MTVLLHRVGRLLRRRPAFRRLWLAGVTTQLGDWVGWVAVSVFTLHAGGGALDLALVFAIHHVPAALMSPVAGPIVDRLDRRVVLVSASLLMATLTVAMTFAAWRADLLLLQGLLLVRSATVAFVQPAERAALPRLVHRDELLLAGSFDAASWSTIFSVGMLAGGLLTTIGPVLALGFDAASFVVAALMFARLPSLRPEASPGRRGGLSHALGFMRGRRGLQLAVLGKAPMALASGAGWLLVALHVGSWAAAGIGFGLVHAVRGVGTAVGPLAVARLAREAADARTLWPAMMLVGAGGLLLLAVSEHPVLVAIAAMLWGVASGANWVLSTEAQQRLAPDGVLGRLGALDGFAWTLAMCVGATVVAAAADLWHAGPAALIGLTALAAVAWAALFARARTVGAEPPGR